MLSKGKCVCVCSLELEAGLASLQVVSFSQDMAEQAGMVAMVSVRERAAITTTITTTITNHHCQPHHQRHHRLSLSVQCLLYCPRLMRLWIVAPASCCRLLPPKVAHTPHTDTHMASAPFAPLIRHPFLIHMLLGIAISLPRFYSFRG